MNQQPFTVMRFALTGKHAPKNERASAQVVAGVAELAAMTGEGRQWELLNRQRDERLEIIKASLLRQLELLAMLNPPRPLYEAR